MRVVRVRIWMLMAIVGLAALTSASLRLRSRWRELRLESNRHATLESACKQTLQDFYRFCPTSLEPEPPLPSDLSPIERAREHAKRAEAIREHAYDRLLKRAESHRQQKEAFASRWW
jgi:hypothetical protein